MSSETEGELELPLGNPKTWSLVALIVGIVYLITIPYAMSWDVYNGVLHFNYLVFGISATVAIIIIILSAIDYYMKKKGNNSIVIPSILLIIGIIMLFLYNAYGHNILNQYHLYIFNIISYKSPYYVFYAYKASALARSAQGAVWGLTFGFGLFLLLSMIIDIVSIRKQQKSN